MALALSLAMASTLLAAAPITAAAADATTRLANLTVNYQANPLAIDREKVRFGWQMDSDAIGLEQSSYRIVVTRGAPGGSQVWDSGNVHSGLATGVRYGGPELALETRYYWTVAVTDNYGRSHVSEPGYFETGTSFSGATWILPIKSLQNDANDPLTDDHKKAGNTYNVPNAEVQGELLAQFGFAPSTTGWERTAAATGALSSGNLNNYAALGGNPLMRAEVALDRPDAVSATLYMTGLGNYEAYVNGGKAMMTDPQGNPMEPILAPGASDYRLFTNYQAYDVTDLVLAHSDKVVLAAKMDKGYYAGRVASSNFNPSDNFGTNVATTGRPWRLPGSTNSSRTLALLGKLVVTYANGTTQVIGTDAANWKSIAGPVVFNDYYMGEFLDANRAQELAGWNDVGFDDSGWYAVTDKGMVQQGASFVERDFASAFALSGSKLEPNNGAIASFNESMTQYPIGAFKFSPDQIVRPTDEQFLASIEERETGALLAPTAEFFTINQRGSVSKSPVSHANDRGAFASPITLGYGEVLAVDFGQNLSGTVQMDVSGPKDTIIKVRHAEMVNDNVALRTTGLSVNGGPDAPEFSLYYGAMRGWDGQTSYYKMSDEPRQTWRPDTVYNGFQHAEISVETPGSTITIYGLASMVITSAHNRTGRIETNNAMINRMIENGFWGQVSNWSTIPTDCNQRTERAGWTGDAQIISNAAMFNFDALPFYDAYMEMIDQNGKNYGWTYGAIMPAGWGATQYTQTASGWADSGIVIPWQAFQKSGDTFLIDRNWESMEGYVDRIYGNGPDGNNGTFTLSGATIRRQHTYVTNQYGDWLAFKGANLTYVSAVYQIYTTVLMRKMAEAVGNAAAAEKFASRYDELKTNFLKPPVLVEVAVSGTNRYGVERVDGGFVYDEATAAWVTEVLGKPDRTNVSPLEAQRASGDLMSAGTRQGSVDDIMDNAQTALVWALHLGLYKDEAHRQHLVDSLLANIANEGRLLRNEPEYSLGVGFLGVNMLLPVATNVGGYELAYKAVQQDRVPGWMAPVRNLATTWWERWNSFDVTFGFGPSSMNSFNHFSYGCVNEWFYEYVLGLKPVETSPGYKQIVLQPTIDTADYSDVDNFELAIEPITRAEGHYDSLYGRIESAWTAQDGKLATYKFKIPANTSATLYLPVDAAAMEGFENIPGVFFKGMATNNGIEVAEFDVLSGGFEFEDVDGKIVASRAAGYVSGATFVGVRPDAGRVSFGPGAAVGYTFMADELDAANLIELTFTVDGGMVGAGMEGGGMLGGAAAKIEALNGFEVFEGLRWTELGDGMWQGSVILGTFSGVTKSGAMDVASIAFDPLALGDAALTLTSASVYGIDIVGGVAQSVRRPSALSPAAATARVYSIYDIDGDDKVDLADLSLAFYHYLAREGDADWEAAKVADVNGDGVVNMLDLVSIYANFVG